jgi:ATP-dependent Clp protease, protease subunit
MKKNDDYDDVFDRVESSLLDHSIHFLVGEISEENITDCIKWIVYENLTQKSDKVLTIYINSVGGDLYQAFGLIDAMRNSKLPIRTIGIGTVMSAAFLIFACGSIGERYISKNAGIMCHQFSGSTEGKYHDIKAEMKENDRLNQTMYDILKAVSGLDGRIIKGKLLPPSDVYLTAEEMVDFNLADHIL